MASLSEWATDELWPDLVVLLEVPLSVSIQRTGGARDRLEAAGDAFHRRVHDGFLPQAIADPDRWVIIDGSQSEDDGGRSDLGGRRHPLPRPRLITT